MAVANSDPGAPSSIPELCRAAAGGALEAVERLIALHHARFLGLARRKLGVEWAGRIEPEDLLQETYLDVFAGISSLTGADEDSFYRWVSRILEHKFIDHLRRWRSAKRDVRRENPPTPGSAYDVLLDRVQAASNTPSRVLRREEAVGALLIKLAQLPADARVAVVRLYLQGAALKDVAEDMHRSPDAVRKLAERALDRLREDLARASVFLSRG